MAEKTVSRPGSEQAPPRREDTYAKERYIAPPVDIYEDAAALTVVADLPGVDKAGLDVRVEDGILTIRGKASHVAPGAPVHQEYELLDFFRQFELPEQIEVDGIRADLKHGVLALRLPKKEKARPRKIEVSVS